MQVFENQEFWFAARTRANQELGLRDSLKKYNITHYLPTHIITRRISDRVKKVEVPVISNLIFIKTTKAVAFSLIKDFSLKISYLRNTETNSLLVVPDKQMSDFMYVMDFSPESVKHCTANFSPGDRVRVVKGNLSGIEGELVRIDGKTHVMLRIPQILAISIKIPKSYLEKIHRYNHTKI